MKRLLCVLMVMVMAVLTVPAIAGEAVIEVTTVLVRDLNGEQQLTNGQSYTASQGHNGMLFSHWDICKEYEGRLKLLGNVNKQTISFKDVVDVEGTIAFAIYIDTPAPEPEPVVVVEEKKPEEPHVHAEEWVPGTPATCTSTGLTDGIKCKWCGEVLKAQTEIPIIDHVYSMWVPNGSGKHYASCLYCGNKIDAACEKVQLPIKSTSGAAITLCPVCGDCNGATATAVKGSQVGEGAPYRGTLRVWNIDAGDGNKYLAVSFDRFGKVMQPEGEVSVTLPDDLKGTTAGVIGADGNVKTVQESNGTLKLDFTGSQVVVLKGN